LNFKEFVDLNEKAIRKIAKMIKIAEEAEEKKAADAKLWRNRALKSASDLLFPSIEKNE
jgi:hypothetical protein